MALFRRKTKDPSDQLRSEVKQWSDIQLRMRSAHLAGSIDGLIARQRDIYTQLAKAVDDVSAHEALQRVIEIDSDDGTLEHLRWRERKLQDQLEAVASDIARYSRELGIIEHELYGRN